MEVEPDGKDILIGRVTVDAPEAVHLSDITRNPLPGRLGLLGIYGNRFVRLSHRAGEAVLIKNLGGVLLDGLATHNKDRIYGSISRFLYEIHPGTGEVKLKGEFGQFITSIGSIAFSDGGTLFAVLDSTLANGAPDVNFLARIDTATAAPTLVGELRMRGTGFKVFFVYGMSFFGGELYGLTGQSGSLIKIDTLTAVVDFVRDLDFDATGSGAPGRE